MVQAGKYYTLKVVKEVDFGLYLDDGDGAEILLPTRYVPKDVKPDDEIEVFIYHDNDSRLIATTQKPFAIAEEIALMKVVGITNHGAFLEWGIMKDLFLPLSQQSSKIIEGEYYLVYLYLDEQTGRMAATEKFERYLSEDELTVKENEEVEIIVWQKTDIGYKMIINNKHIGVLHFSDIFRELEYGEKIKGFIKRIRPDNKIDVKIGERGYQRISNETEQIIKLLKESDGYLPYNDKSEPDKIYAFFGISKKSFKMAVGALYKQRRIELTQTGIKLVDN